MKHLFDEDDKWTELCSQLDKETKGAIAPLFKKWVEAGYSIRQIEQIMHGTIVSESLLHLLRWGP